MRIFDAPAGQKNNLAPPSGGPSLALLVGLAREEHGLHRAVEEGPGLGEVENVERRLRAGVRVLHAEIEPTGAP